MSKAQLPGSMIALIISLYISTMSIISALSLPLSLTSVTHELPNNVYDPTTFEKVPNPDPTLPEIKRRSFTQNTTVYTQPLS